MDSTTRDRPGERADRNGVPLNVPGQNRLLAALPAGVREAVLGRGERVGMDFKQPLIEAGRPMAHVYFPLGGVFSVLTDAPGGGVVETATIGNEGMVGVPRVLGMVESNTTVICQVPGEALRLPERALAELMGAHDSLRGLLLRYAQSLFDFVAQTAACNRMHNIEERAARWLMMTRDRVGADEFPLTHEFLAQMLGVRRAGVTVAMGMLQKAGLVTYSRGVVRVTDLEGLRGASCDCYGIVRRQAERLLE
jgi:CRP-like cAMP-binding protein